MNCPNCGETLRERERAGIEIDVCPVCRGVWLDRGELDKLIDRESRYYDDDDDDSRTLGREREYARQGGRLDDHGRERGYGGPPQKQRKKKGFFQSVMETFGEGWRGRHGLDARDVRLSFQVGVTVHPTVGGPVPR